MRYFLTTAIDFVNSKPHLGTAYEKITADIIARYRRLAGFDTHFLMGNDEHSQNVFRKAAEQGKDPLAYCDEMEQVFRDVWKRLDLSFDDSFARPIASGISPRSRRWRKPAWTTATFTKVLTRAGIAKAASPSNRKRTSSRACVRSTRRSRSGSRKRTGSSACRNTSSRS
jgi:leucyl-tRNA synthetase